MAITGWFSTDIFMLVPMSRLSKGHFDVHPIWSEFYDAEEVDEIVSWGVDREWLERELERVHHGNDHAAYPILRPYPLPERMRLFIGARFVTAGGAELDGWVMNENAFVVTLNVNEHEFTFSAHLDLADLNRPELQRLKQAMGAPEDPVFPLHYETEFLGHDDELIAGGFNPVT